MSERAAFGLASVLSLPAVALLLAAPAPANAGVHFQWVFARDKVTTDFFQPKIKNDLQQAADNLTRRLGDNLERRSITNPSNPGWLRFDPSDWGNKKPPTLASYFENADAVDIPADTIVVIVGAHPAGSDRLNHGGSTYSFDDPMNPSRKNVDKRGTSHAVAYVGVLSFANDPSFTGPNPARDFIASAEHELGHILGLINDQVDWDAKTSGNGGQQQYFVGPFAVAAYKMIGGDVGPTHPGIPLDIRTPGHWAPSHGDPQSPDQEHVGFLQTKSGTAVHAAMQEITQVRFTPVDFAALKDIGWQL
jgi:hypothetical protein